MYPLFNLKAYDACVLHDTFFFLICHKILKHCNTVINVLEPDET